MPYLVINTEGKPPLRRALERAVVIGRSRDADMMIDDSRLSRQHCRFEPDDTGHWSVIDLSSTNGTFVAGEKIAAHRLDDGDEVVAGRTRFVFHARSAPPARPERPVRSASDESAVARALNPSDTLVDSRFPQPRVEPAPPVSSPPVSNQRPAASLAFQRPPATPKVAGERDNVVRKIWRRLMGR